MRSRFHELVGRLRRRTAKLFGEREQANADGRSALERELSLGLEQQWKIGTQLLLPAAWLAQWAQDLRAGGDTEDEDRNAVGEPPR
jgi:hypothetical protein